MLFFKKCEKIKKIGNEGTYVSKNLPNDVKEVLSARGAQVKELDTTDADESKQIEVVADEPVNNDENNDNVEEETNENNVIFHVPPIKIKALYKVWI